MTRKLRNSAGKRANRSEPVSHAHAFIARHESSATTFILPLSAAEDIPSVSAACQARFRRLRARGAAAPHGPEPLHPEL